MKTKWTLKCGLHLGCGARFTSSFLEVTCPNCGGTNIEALRGELDAHHIKFGEDGIKVDLPPENATSAEMLAFRREVVQEIEDYLLGQPAGPYRIDRADDVKGGTFNDARRAVAEIF